VSSKEACSHEWGSCPPNFDKIGSLLYDITEKRGKDLGSNPISLPEIKLKAKTLPETRL
jgi:hypothetical protein